MNEQEMKEAVKQWLDERIEYYNKLGEPFNPTGSEDYYDCPRCIEVHPSDKAMHLCHTDKVAELLGIPSKWEQLMLVGELHNKHSFVYKGFEFFSVEKVKEEK